MTKVLVIITTAFVSYGGLTTVMMNYFRAMDRSGIQIDFASTNVPEQRLLAELSRFGSRYFNLGARREKPLSYAKKLANLLDENCYEVIHVNGNSATMVLELSIAKKKGVPRRIAHVHTDQSRYCGISALNRVMRPYLCSLCTYRLAVSEKAGRWLYEDSYMVINNAIEVEKYRFDRETREEYRKLLGAENRLVIGHVGKFYDAKNHIFLLHVFVQVIQKRPDALLLLVGGGEKEPELRKQCKSLGIENNVIFTGIVDNPQDYLQAMDAFVFPSLYEGLGLAVIEAQANGLPCFVSDAVPMETEMSVRIEYISLSVSPNDWASSILRCILSLRERERSSAENIELIKNCGYDIEYEAWKLRSIYLSNC